MSDHCTDWYIIDITAEKAYIDAEKEIEERELIKILTDDDGSDRENKG